MAVSTKGVGRFTQLYKKSIPRYPLYRPGNPQLRLLLPQFWMKLIKPKKEIPPDQAHFEVHPQMSVHDVKQYLEKIYKVPVLSVRVKVIQGEDIKHAMEKHVIAREDDRKQAYVQLGDGCTFTFPDIFENVQTETEKQIAEYKKAVRAQEQESRKQWEKASLPVWFR